MKKAGCAALGCLGMLALAAVFAGLLALDAVERASAPEPPPPGPPAPGPPAPDPEAYLPRVGSLGEFGRAEEGDVYRLRYGFIDYQGRRRLVTCTIGKREHDRERTTFGYVKGEPERVAIRRLKQVVDARIAAAGIGDYFHFEVQPGTSQWKWEWEVPGSVTEPERGRAVAASERLGAWIRQNARATVDSLEADLYRDRGFALKAGQLQIDYQGVADRATEPLRDCFEALEREGRGSSLRQYLGMFTAFLQELRYEVPPDYDGDRYIHGFWVPTEVLVRGRGDCDSKAATFCALWRRFPSRLLFLLLPRHALVGVEAAPRPGENFVRLGNRYFVLCEVAGGAKIHPGREPLSGAYEYILLEPLAGSG